MIRIFNCNRNAIGQFMVALIFLGTFGFLFTFDGFVSKSQASGCCSGGEAVVTSFAADSSGDFDSDVSVDAPAANGCQCVPGSICTSCAKPNDCGGSTIGGCGSKNGTCTCSSKKIPCCDSTVCNEDGTDCNGPDDC